MWTARTRLDLGELALARGDRESAIAHLGEARSEAVHIGLSALIDRIDGLLRALCPPEGCPSPYLKALRRQGVACRATVGSRDT